MNKAKVEVVRGVVRVITFQGPNRLLVSVLKAVNILVQLLALVIIILAAFSYDRGPVLTACLVALLVSVGALLTCYSYLNGMAYKVERVDYRDGCDDNTPIDFEITKQKDLE